MFRRLLLSLLSIGLGTALPAAEPVTRKTAEVITRLIADLGSDDYETREAAVRQLEALGPAAQPAVEKAIASRDAEVRRLAIELAQTLARRQETARVLEPKRVRLAYRDLPLSAAVEDFARVTGCHVCLDPDAAGKLAGRKVTLDTGLTTFWDAYDKFCRAAGLTEKRAEAPLSQHVSYRPDLIQAQMEMSFPGQQPDLPDFVQVGGELVLTDGKPGSLPTFNAGALRIRALPPGTPAGPWAQMKGDRELLLALEVLPEPGLVWQKVLSVRVERAVDEHGRILVQPHVFLNEQPSAVMGDRDDLVLLNSDVVAAAPSGQREQQVPVLLRQGRQPASRLKELQGTLTARVQAPPQPLVTVDNILKAAGQSAEGKDGMQLKVVEVQREEKGRLTLRVQIDHPRPEGMNPFGGLGGWAWRRNIMWGGAIDVGEVPADDDGLLLLDVNGHLVKRVGVEQFDDGSGGSLDYRLTFQAAPGQADPQKLVLQGHRSALLEVPFTLKDVPLR